MKIEKEGICLFCKSKTTEFIQDKHHLSDNNNALVGILKCLNCGMISFWYAKVKQKTKLEGNVISITARPVIKIVPQWDGPISPWLYSYMEESSRLTGRPLETYYSNIIINNGDITERKLEFKKL